MDKIENAKREIDGLLESLREGELSQAQADYLDSLIRNSPELRRRYIRGIAMQVGLRKLSAAAAGQPPAAPASSVLGFLGDVGRQGWGFLSDHTLPLLVVAVLAVAGILAIGKAKKEPEVAKHESEISDRQPGSAKPSPAFARLVDAKDCRWNGQSSAPEVGQMLQVGQSLSLASGVAEIDFDIGAKVILQSPAAFQVVSDKSARLEMGKATVEINTEAARGFNIFTPEATFVDQGTEFGVEVTPGRRSKIHVFKGKVDVERKAKEGGAAVPTQRLVENAGARLEPDEDGMTLVQETGECFIRSMDEAGRDQHVVAYWRFEDRPVGVLLPDTAAGRGRVCATVDSSFNGNDLYVGMERNRPMFSADVAAASVGQTGRANRSCLDTSRPTTEINRLNVYTHSLFSHSAPLDIQQIEPMQWTIEASVKAAKLLGKPQGFLGRDGAFTTSKEPRLVPPRLTFQINARDRFAVTFYDADGRFHEAVAEELPVAAGRWYHLAATSDGRVLRLYVDALDGRGYVERAAAQLPADGSTALGKGFDTGQWSIGRAGNVGDPADWLRFWGLIDEVRISDVARRPEEFLFVPRKEIAN